MNNRSFEDLESTLEEILSSFYFMLYFWTTAYVHHLSFSFDDFLAHFSLSNLVLPMLYFWFLIQKKKKKKKKIICTLKNS
jgi:hypothetical protein